MTFSAYSPSTIELVDRATALARAGTGPVLILGETGVGKTALAKLIHERSGRRGPFAVVDCGTLRGDLAGSALFGHVAGAFTGARGDRQGAFQYARQGTLLIDEIGELPLDLQAELLRAIEDRIVVPLGADQPIAVDVMLIAATNRPLREMVDDGTFRKDLYYRIYSRLRVLDLPPLRDRREDLLAIASEIVGDRGRPLTHAAEAWLLSQPWEGNVRELIRELTDTLALTTGATVDVAHLTTREPAATPPETAVDLGVRLLAALQRHGGNHTRTARALGWSRRRLRREAERLGVSLPPSPPGRPHATGVPSRPVPDDVEDEE